jgi:hypothetical protein
MDIYGFFILLSVWLLVLFLAIKNITGKDLSFYKEKLGIKARLASKTKAQVLSQAKEALARISETSEGFDREIKTLIEGEMIQLSENSNSNKVLKKLSDKISKYQVELHELNKKIYELSQYKH